MFPFHTESLLPALSMLSDSHAEGLFKRETPQKC